MMNADDANADDAVALTLPRPVTYTPGLPPTRLADMFGTYGFADRARDA
jgi:hypothetical protein